jgi:AraC-like DNA-binding protein
MNIRIETPKMELWRIENEFTNVPHSHEGQVQLTVPIHGTCHFTHERREYRLVEGCALVQHPREEHHFRIGDNAGVIIIQLQAGSLAEEARQEELSFRQYLNPKEVQSRFRDWVGLILARDPYQYMLHARIEEAKRKLRTTRMSVTDISLYLGFSSTSLLHRAFMNAVGMSPEQFRR